MTWTLVTVLVHLASGGDVATVKSYPFATEADCQRAGEVFVQQEPMYGLAFKDTFECVATRK